MDRSNVLELITTTTTKNRYGVDIKHETSRTVFCRVDSITQTEFFSAGQNGMQPAAKFIILDAEYAHEKNVRYNDRTYSVYRTYRRTDDTIELYCQEEAGV